MVCIVVYVGHVGSVVVVVVVVGSSKIVPTYLRVVRSRQVVVAVPTVGSVTGGRLMTAIYLR